MSKFIEQNKRMLNYYCIAARISGWPLLVLGSIWGGIYYLRVISGIGDWQAMVTEVNNMPSGIFQFIFFGLIALGTAQLVGYMLEMSCKPGWLLRYGEHILYVCSILLIINHVWTYIHDPAFHSSHFYLRFLLGLLMLLFTIVKVLILVGLAQILQRVMPVIEEHKSLV